MKTSVKLEKSETNPSLTQSNNHNTVVVAERLGYGYFIDVMDRFI